MAQSLPTSDQVPDDEFDVDLNDATDITTTLERLREFSYYLVENVELNLNLCLRLLEERDVPSKPNSIYTTGISKLLSAVPKVGSALGNALAKGEIVVFNKIDKKNSRILADLVYYFSEHKEEMRNILIQSSIDIFFSFEHQFMKLSCKGGPKRAMQKLAKDASDRIFNYFLKTEQNRDITRTEVAKGVLFGDSKRNKAGVKEGKTVMNDENKWKTCKLYRKTGIVMVEQQTFFRNKDSKTVKYGHRRLLPWENPDEIREAWEIDTGFEIPNYKLTVKEDIIKVVRDYIRTKNPYDEAKLERENYSKEALKDRQLKYEEMLRIFEGHFKKLLEELQRQYKAISDSSFESKELIDEISKNQSDGAVQTREISTVLAEIRKDINETQELIEDVRREYAEIQKSSEGTFASAFTDNVGAIARKLVKAERQLEEITKEKWEQLRDSDAVEQMNRAWSDLSINTGISENLQEIWENINESEVLNERIPEKVSEIQTALSDAVAVGSELTVDTVSTIGRGAMVVEKQIVEITKDAWEELRGSDAVPIIHNGLSQAWDKLSTNLRW